MWFASKVHRRLFNEAIRNRTDASYATMAALFLLTAERGLWNKVRPFIARNRIRFDEISLSNCSDNTYLLFSCAKDLYLGTGIVKISDLAERELISQRMYGVICTAITIARKGLKTNENCSKEEKTHD